MVAKESTVLVEGGVTHFKCIFIGTAVIRKLGYSGV